MPYNTEDAFATMNIKFKSSILLQDLRHESHRTHQILDLMSR
jgi:hypothetical protein